ncbi:MAG: RagB/SusD family nutrient uptake outer membrane protein [Lewinellaceae bacterium]|nr:RagB/SusD family nutrient uptake outer membrane protein [Lewinellaceae bacterium]
MKNIKFMLLAVAILFATACKKDFLELTNPNVQTSGSFWKTEADAVAGVNAIYQSLYYDGTFLRFAQCALDLRGDDVMSPSPWDVLSNTGSFKLFNNTIMQEWLWVAFYGGVTRANLAIANIDKITFTNAALRDRLMGEALFLRALNYYYLVTFFNNVPLVLKPYESSADYFPSQAPPAEVWDQIYADFDQASRLLPVSHNDPDKGRATKGAALAFLGKSYLFNQRFSEASAKLKEVIDLNVYSLMPNFGDNFTEQFENNQESLFEIQFSREVGGTVLGWVDAPYSDWSKTTARAITFAPAPFGWNDAAPTGFIFQKFQEEKTVGGQDDPRLRTTIYYNYPGCTLYGQSFQDVYATELGKIGVKKYGNGDSGRPDEKDWRSGINERLLRYADVLLMYAECQNELGNTGICAEYIQKVRTRANLPDRQTEFAALSKEQMRDRIADERLLEFALEGHRFDDIRRWGWLQNPAKLTELQAHDPEFVSYVPGREFFSIPQLEIETNPNLRQNPGY